MLSTIFRNSKNTERVETRSLFRRATDQLSHPCCLCEGLEVIAANVAFQGAFPDLSSSAGATLLTALTDDLFAVEQLCSGAGGTVELEIVDNGPVGTRHMMFRSQPWAFDGDLWIIEITDLSTQTQLRRELEEACTHDGGTGTLLPQAMVSTLHTVLPDLPRGSAGFYCEIEFGGSLDRSTILSQEQRDGFVSALAERLRAEFGQNCLIARRGGLAVSMLATGGRDAFGDKHALHQIVRVAHHMRKIENVRLKPKIGAALYPDDANTPGELVNCANHALRAPGSVNQYQPEMKEAVLRREQLGREMHEAIGRGDIHPHFQPVICPDSQRLLSFEALVRWNHANLGPVSPPDIIAIAQERKLLDPLTAHLLQYTVREAKNWPNDISFAVNVTPSQLSPGLVDLVRNTINEGQIEPERIEIEVTEDALIHDFETSSTIFARLRAMGISIAMDDFGSGYTSIGNLCRLNFNKIKIDKSVSDGLPDDRRTAAIVRSLMVMARELGIKVTVEGIETKEQLEFLKPHDCGVQGYVFSPPLPREKLGELRKYLRSEPVAGSSHNVVAMAKPDTLSTPH